MVQYTPRTEQLIQQRLVLLKLGAKAEHEDRRRENKQPEEEAFGPLERFGAEIEAFFVGAPVAVGGEPGKPPVPTTSPRCNRGVTLAPLRGESSAAH